MISIKEYCRFSFNRRRDACFPATYTVALPPNPLLCFNRRRDACFPATVGKHTPLPENCIVSIADATLASPQLIINISGCLICQVSIADATLASPQQIVDGTSTIAQPRFNRRRDACFPATWSLVHLLNFLVRFNRRRDACFPATCGRLSDVPAPGSFNRRRDACFPATF